MPKSLITIGTAMACWCICVPGLGWVGTEQSAPFIPTPALQERGCDHPHWVDEEVEAQEGGLAV